MKRISNVVCGFLIVISGACWAQEPSACQSVRLGSTNWSDTIASTAVVKVVLDSLGYNVKLTTASQKIILGSLADKKLDTFLGYWQPTMRPVAAPYLEKKQIEVFEPAALGDAQSTFAVPRYAYDQGLKTFGDIARFKDKLGGKIYVIEPGSGSNRITAKMIADNQFGLSGFQMVESSEAGMLTAVKRAVSRNEWIVFFGWKPHPMNLQLDMAYLTGSEDAFGPNEGAATVSVMTSAGYAARCPNMGRFLHNLTFKSEQVSEVMVPILERVTPEAAAKQWLKANPAMLEPWLNGVTSLDGKEGAAVVRQALEKND